MPEVLTALSNVSAPGFPNPPCAPPYELGIFLVGPSFPPGYDSGGWRCFPSGTPCPDGAPPLGGGFAGTWCEVALVNGGAPLAAISAPAPVPALSEWALLVLALALGLTGVRWLR